MFANAVALLGKQCLCVDKDSKRFSGVAPGKPFVLVGKHPKPFEQSRYRDWLRVRFPNAIVPASQGKAGFRPLGKAGKYAHGLSGKRKKRGWPTSTVSQPRKIICPAHRAFPVCAVPP